MATSRRSPQELRQADAARVTAALALAVKAIEGAAHYAPLWSDDVRQSVEARLGRPFVDSDPAVLEDAEYGAALDFTGTLDRVLDELRSMAAHFEHIDVEYDREWNQP